jgi:hypothetical protein
MKINKITVVDDALTVSYSEQVQEGTESNILLKTSQSIPDALHENIEALKPHAIALLELHPDYSENMSVNSVTFAERKGNLGVVISVKKIVSTSNCPANLHTPLIFETQNEDLELIPSNNGISEGLKKLLKDILELTEEYINEVLEG